MAEKSYESVVRSIQHIGVPMNSYLKFKKTGSIETTKHYLTRLCFIHLFWIALFFSLGGPDLLLAWYTSIFIMAFIIRDFNWRGHGGNFRSAKQRGWEFDTKSRALNQRVYGLTVGEWHDNHHKYPMSANNGFLRGQIDIAFQIIRLMHRLGIVESYMDARPIFEKECLRSPANA